MPSPSRSGAVPIETKGFPTMVKPQQDLEVDDDMLAHALFTTGRAEGDELGHGGHSVAEFHHKWAAVLAYFDFRSDTGHLCRSNLALSLDPSEKAPLSYMTGQAMTQIIAERLLGIRRLLHFDRASTDHCINVGGSERPDLIGWSDHGQVLVAEAKGRARRYDDELLAKCASQLESVCTIDGRSPDLRMASVSWLRGKGVQHYAELSGTSRRALPDHGSSSLPVSDEALVVRSYYAPFLEALALGDPTSNLPDHSGAVFVDLGVEIYLPANLVDLIRSFEPLPESVAAVDQAIAEAVAPTGETAFLDGSIFHTHRSQLGGQSVEM